MAVSGGSTVSRISRKITRISVRFLFRSVHLNNLISKRKRRSLFNNLFCQFSVHPFEERPSMHAGSRKCLLRGTRLTDLAVVKKSLKFMSTSKLSACCQLVEINDKLDLIFDEY